MHDSMRLFEAGQSARLPAAVLGVNEPLPHITESYVGVERTAFCQLELADRGSKREADALDRADIPECKHQTNDVIRRRELEDGVE